MSEVARIVFRTEDEGEKAGAILGACFKNQDIFKGGDVWEIKEFLGELVLRKVGKSCVGLYLKDSVGTVSCWGHEIGSVLTDGDYILTQEEMQELREKQEQENS